LVGLNAGQNRHAELWGMKKEKTASAENGKETYQKEKKREKKPKERSLVRQALRTSLWGRTVIEGSCKTVQAPLTFEKKAPETIEARGKARTELEGGESSNKE